MLNDKQIGLFLTAIALRAQLVATWLSSHSGNNSSSYCCLKIQLARKFQTEGFDLQKTINESVWNSDNDSNEDDFIDSSKDFSKLCKRGLFVTNCINFVINFVYFFCSSC